MSRIYFDIRHTEGRGGNSSRPSLYRRVEDALLFFNHAERRRLRRALSAFGERGDIEPLRRAVCGVRSAPVMPRFYGCG